MNQNRPICNHIIRASVWILTIINTTVFLVSRNSFWISHPGQAWLAASSTADRTYLASEFERNLSCYAPAICLRSGGAFLTHSLIKITTLASESTRINLTIDQQTFIILIGGMLWRITCLAIFVFAVAKLFDSPRLGLLVVNGVVFLLSGLPLWQFGRLLVNLPLNLSPSFISRTNEAFIHMSFGDLLFYDYGFFALIPMTALALSKLKNLRIISCCKFFVIGFFVASFYEAFVLIVFLSLTIFIALHREVFLLKSIWLFVGQFTWTLTRIFTLRFTEVADPQSPFFIEGSFLDYIYYMSTSNKGISTTSSLPSIAIQLTLISILASALGFFARLITIRLEGVKPIDERSFRSISAVTFAVSIVIAGSFLRPVFVETGRQSLGLSIALALFSFTYSQKFFLDGKLKLRVEKVDSVQKVSTRILRRGQWRRSRPT